MEQLPYIDEYSTTIAADPEDTWAALLAVMCGNPDEATRSPIGFAVGEALPRQRLVLKGRHWFSVYRLVFLLEEAHNGTGDLTVGTRVHAQTWAAFPGLKGTIYRALVIGSRGHRVAVRLMLHRIATDATKRAARQTVVG